MKPVTAIDQSLSGQAWRWRGGNMDVAADNPGNLGDNLVDQLLLARGVERSDLDRHRRPTLRDFLPDPSIFRDMDKAATRLADAIGRNEAIAVYGDYDVDGATSAALLVRLLAACGVRARPYIPDRLLEGYGPTGEALVRLGAEGASLIVTVDCGAMAYEALAMAADAGVEVIVVDHHKCAAELPRAMALVNPNRLDESDEAAAFGHLAAVGMAFLLAVATLRELRARGFFGDRRPPDLMSLLDLVALGTVADVAQLRGLNRALVAQGLKVLARRENTGLAALIDASRLNRSPTCSDLGFALGPRINAAGRIGDSSLGVRLLTTADPDEARDIAARLSGSMTNAAVLNKQCRKQPKRLLLVRKAARFTSFRAKAGTRASSASSRDVSRKRPASRPWSLRSTRTRLETARDRGARSQASIWARRSLPHGKRACSLPVAAMPWPVG
jgi:single-stranded-DNA-specific exonuclease